MNQLNKIIVLLLNIIILNVYHLNTFNICPKPDLIFYEPELQRYLPKIRSSYFGYSINLRTSSLIVGAPRAQSNEQLQRNVNETGAIYKCSLVSGKCSAYVFDKYGNKKSRDDDYTWNSEKKDFQWLGATIDGGSRDDETLIVCAPRTCADVIHEYLMHGICYWVSDTISDQPQNIKIISPLRTKTLQIREIEIPGFQSEKSFYYMFGESGLSLHWSDVNEEILIGAPGIDNWKGSIIRYRSLDLIDKSNSPTNQNMKNYISETLTPYLWKQPNYSYFGYSVSSGIFDHKNKSKLLYVASAPIADDQTGEVYIFDIEKANRQFTILKHKTFSGDQFGEYFGYLVLSEDINKDGLTDLLISAPLYSVDKSYDNGAVYLFVNNGHFNFEKQIIISPSNEPSRFGSTMTKLGDINHDGFNDIAIGAPFDKSGSVFIYLGGPNGLREKPSQVLNISELSKYKKGMFGHGLSRGVDIDFNGFNDFAVGAPGLEAVFLYKSYPVVKILASISLTNSVMKLYQTTLELKACFKIETSSKNLTSQQINITFKADQYLKRVTFENGGNEFSFISTASLTEQCKIYDANVKLNLRNIIKPIEVEMHYKLNNNISDSEKFCDTCAVVDPMEDTVTKQKITFSTGCKNEVCVADLKLTTSKIEPTFILGSSRTLAIEFNVLNAGEAAYLPQLNISSSNNMKFAKIPSNCVEKEMMLLCDLFRGHPLLNGNKDSLSIVFDTSNIYGTNMMIIAEVLSAGKQQNRGDNMVNITIFLKEFSSIEAVGSSSKAIINLKDIQGSAQFINNFEIKNIGPSCIEDIEVIISYPVSYINPKTDIRNDLIEFSATTFNGTYAANEFTISIVNQTKTTNYNKEDNSKRKLDKLINEDLVETLPLNRTILFNCNGPDEVLCMQTLVRFRNFQANDNVPISMVLKYNVNLNEINKLLVNDKEFFVITTELNLNKLGDEKRETMIIKKMILPHNIISKY